VHHLARRTLAMTRLACLPSSCHKAPPSVYCFQSDRRNREATEGVHPRIGIIVALL